MAFWVFLAIIAILAIVLIWQRFSIKAYLAKAAAEGEVISLNGQNWFIRKRGSGKQSIVIETALAGLSAEWWELQDKLAQNYSVFSYDRPAYGWSAVAQSPRNPETIAQELHALLDAAQVAKPYLLIGHSQGGLYMQEFARLFPEDVAGLILLDPLSPDDKRWQEALAPELYQGSGIDKSPNLRMGYWAAQLGILGFLEPLFRQSPPFYYMKTTPETHRRIIWKLMLRPEFYRGALEEYQLRHQANRQNKAFPAVPVMILYHDPAVSIAELEKYGGLSHAQAQEVEVFWEKLLRELLSLSPKSDWRFCEGSGHFIHLSRPDMLLAAVHDMAKDL